MVIEILSFASENKELFNQAIQIRFDVFTSEHNISKDIEYDGLDFEAVHYLVKVDNVSVAAARWRETDEGIVIERISVLKSFRKLGYANLLLRNILSELVKSHQKIYLFSNSNSENLFYSAGFVKEQNNSDDISKDGFKMIFKR
ncbi:MAG: GNAT family N-acetyltransferase [Bacteroidales bacterium]|nr:GNAT family N-acetyltransferase [Bacteroidales bacterium]